MSEPFRLEPEVAPNVPRLTIEQVDEVAHVSPIRMRDYQSRAADSVMESFKESATALVVMPTGTGKTILFSEIIRRFHPRRAIVLAHREELIFQAKHKIQSVTGLNVDVEMAYFHAETRNHLLSSPDVIVSTIQTQTAGNNGGRMQKFNPADFGLVIVDEGHHATAGSYRKVIDYYRENPLLKVLGVTATPDRADEEALGQVYETVAFDYEILDAIRDGWLVPINQQMVEVHGLDFSSVKTTAGDLNGGDLAEVMEYESNLHGIADPTIAIAGERRTLVFAASVAHAERLCEIFNRHKPGCAAWVCGKTDKDDRRRVLSDFASGAVQFVVNVGVLTEGFDDPGVECIAMARPTKSRSLYAQMAGRATRPLPGVVDGHEKDTPEQRCAAILASRKPSCLIIDFVGNAGRHKLMTTADILGGNVSDEVSARAAKMAREAGAPVRMDTALEMAEEEIKAEQEKRKQLEEARRARLLAKAQYSSQTIDPFDAFGITPQRDRGWDVGKQLTEKQTALLLKQGIDPTGMNYAAAKQLLNELFRRWDKKLCTFKQQKLLRKHGYTGEYTMDEARTLIDRIAANGWRRPD